MKSRFTAFSPRYLYFGVPKGIPFGHAQGKFTPVVPPERRDVLEEGWKEKKACSFQSKPLMDAMASPRGRVKYHCCSKDLLIAYNGLILHQNSH